MYRPVHGLLIAAFFVASAGGPLLAQRTRFPGDSPTRPAVMNGRVLGTPSYRRPGTATFATPQGGYGGYQPYGCWGLGSNYYYSGPYYPPAGVPYYQAYPYYSGVRVVDYRVLFGMQPPQAMNNPGAGPAAGPAAGPGPAKLQPPARQPQPKRAAALKRAWRYLDQGDRHLREQRLREARNRYRRAEKAAPQLADVHFRMVFLELATGRFEEAADALREGLALDPEWPKSGFALQNVLNNAGQHAAERALSARLREFPNNVDARLLLGVMRHFQGEPRLAQEQFQRVLKVDARETAALSFLEQPLED